MLDAKKSSLRVPDQNLKFVQCPQWIPNWTWFSQRWFFLLRKTPLTPSIHPPSQPISFAIQLGQSLGWIVLALNCFGTFLKIYFWRPTNDVLSTGAVFQCPLPTTSVPPHSGLICVSESAGFFLFFVSLYPLTLKGLVTKNVISIFDEQKN